MFETLLHSSETSGGLLIAVPPEGADALRDRLHDEGHGVAEVVGRVVAEHPGEVRVID